MRIRRSRLTADFVQVPNRTARDERLGYMARGVLVELLSRPDGWEATADDLWRRAQEERGPASESRRDLRAAFAELKAAGYLVASRERLESGRFGTVLTLYDVPAGDTDVPASGTSVRAGETRIPAGGTDVPHAGTPVPLTDVPHAGTSVRPGETSVLPAHTDVPVCGTPEPPGETPVSAGRTDVPPAGTSNKKTVLENREENSLSAAEQQIVNAVEATAEEAREMIRIIRTDNPRIGTLAAYLATMAGNGTLAALRNRVRTGDRADLPQAIPTPIAPPVHEVLAEQAAHVPQPRGDAPPPPAGESIAKLRARIGSAAPKTRQTFAPPAEADPAVEADRAYLNSLGNFPMWIAAAREKLGDKDAPLNEVIPIAAQLARERNAIRNG